VSVTFFSASGFDFFATFCPQMIAETEYRVGQGCKRILQTGCMKRRTAPTVPPCDISFSAG
jgi:hypothetical protein